jgi:hypothetical protein
MIQNTKPLDNKQVMQPNTAPTPTPAPTPAPTQQKQVMELPNEINTK